MEICLFVGLVVVLDVAALIFGYDSRDTGAFVQRIGAARF